MLSYMNDGRGEYILMIDKANWGSYNLADLNKNQSLKEFAHHMINGGGYWCYHGGMYVVDVGKSIIGIYTAEQTTIIVMRVPQGRPTFVKDAVISPTETYISYEFQEPTDRRPVSIEPYELIVSCYEYNNMYEYCDAIGIDLRI